MIDRDRLKQSAVSVLKKYIPMDRLDGAVEELVHTLILDRVVGNSK